jgi:peptidoglycan-associated lipoprotein
MKLTTKKTYQKVLSLLAALLVMSFASACSKKLMPPEIEASSGGSSFSSGGDAGDGSFASGDVGDGGAVAGDSGTGESGVPGEGFNIQEQNESGGGGFFVEENVGESGSGAGGGAPDMSASGDRDFGSTGKFDPGTDSTNSFAFPGVGEGGGAGSGSGSGDGFHGGDGGRFAGDGGAGGGAAGSGSGGRFEEARLMDFQESSDLKDIHFAFDKYDLDDNSKQILRANAEWLKGNPNARIEIQGHCDERGTNNYNLGLGERRAISTKKFLMALGVDESRLFTISYGEEKPFCFESSESCWTENRRAHFMVAR